MSARGLPGQVLLATRSPGKLRELRALVGVLGVEVLDLDAAGVAYAPEEEGVEAFETFAENALAKARHFQQRSGLPTIADDSGLEVTALGGRPGVRSKRWSGREDLSGAALDAANNALLLEAMRGIVDRRARYVCAAAFSDGRRELVRLGSVDGEISHDPSGSGGFGYDPYFVAREAGRSFGELSQEEKARISHRGRALRALLSSLGDEPDGRAGS